MKPKAIAFAATVLLGLTQGCASVSLTAPGQYEPVEPAVARVLASSVDQAPDKLFRLLRPPAPVEFEPPPSARAEAAAAERGKLKFGLRGGMMRTGDSEREWADAVSAGIYLRPSPGRNRPVLFEVGADFLSAETLDGVRTSSLLFLKGDLLFGSFGPSGVTAYFLAGGHAVLEQSENTSTGVTGEGRGAGAEVGFGLGARNGSWDLRGAYSILLASENAENNLTVSLGLAF